MRSRRPNAVDDLDRARIAHPNGPVLQDHHGRSMGENDLALDIAAHLQEANAEQRDKDHRGQRMQRHAPDPSGALGIPYGERLWFLSFGHANTTGAASVRL